MIRKIIKIDEEKCIGCGACAAACHEGAIAMVDGKARLIRDDYCDGLGDCLPSCPTEAISFEEREAAAYDQAAVLTKMADNSCPAAHENTAGEPKNIKESNSRLLQWPVQIKLVPVRAPYFDGARLLVSADCAAYAYGSFHKDFMDGRITLIGCPKLDMVDYGEKLAEILRQNDIKDITAVRMEVPCCGGIERAVKEALKASGKIIPLHIYIIGTDGIY